MLVGSGALVLRRAARRSTTSGSLAPTVIARCAEAIELLRAKVLPMGLFPLENAHQGAVLFELEAEGEGFPSRWVTLRALRVLRWWDAGLTRLQTKNGGCRDPTGRGIRRSEDRV